MHDRAYTLGKPDPDQISSEVAHKRTAAALCCGRSHANSDKQYSVVPTHAADDPADAQRRERHRVRPRLDGMAHIVLDIHGVLANGACGIDRRILRLPVEV